MRRIPTALSWGQRGALGVLVAALVFFGLRANGNTAAEIATRDASVWLISPTTGTIVQASERAREVMATVDLGGSGQLSAGQLSSGAVVLDRSAGTVGLVNGSTLRFGPTAQLGPSSTDLALVSGGDHPYVVDTAGGRLVALDPRNLGTVASADITPQHSTPAVVDPDGQLWALDVGRGQVVGLRHDGQVHRAEVTEPMGDGQLTLVDGEPVLVDPGAGSVARLDPMNAEVERRWCLDGPVEGPLHVAGTTKDASEPRAYTLAAETGELFTTNLRTGACVRLQLRAAEESDATGTFGQPVSAGDLLFVPMPAKGEVLVVDGATNRIERSIRVLSRPDDRGHRFELFNDEGTVWFNDLEGPTAGVLSREGITFFLDKYQSGTDRVGTGQGRGQAAGVGTESDGEPVDQDPTKGGVARDGEVAGGEGSGTGTGSGSGEGDGASKDGLSPSLGGGPEGEDGGPGDASTEIPTEVPEPDVAQLSVLPPGDPAALPKATPTTPGPASVSAIPGTSQTPTPAGPSPERPPEVKAPSTPPPDTLLANFRWEPGGQIDPTTTVTFTDTSVGQPTSWVWSFTAPDATSTTASGPQVKRTFDKIGVWTVTLTVGNGERVDTSLPATIVVRDPDETAPPTPDFSWDPATPTVNETVTFKDRSRGRGISEWLWDFGDGTTSTAQDPTKVWTNAGSYLVKLTVKNAHGSTKAEARITVAPEPEAIKADFTYTGLAPNTGAAIVAGQPVEFQDRSTGGPTSWQWDFKDGTTGTGATFVHRFQKEGTYEVTLRVSNEKSSATISKAVKVEPAPAPPEARIAQPDGDTAVEVGRRLRFVSGTTGNVTRQVWDWGDGTRTEGASADKVWDKPGPYKVTLTASNSTGSTTASLVVTVTEAPPGPIIPSFRPEPGGSPDTPAEVGQNVLFVNQSQGEGTFLWDFGDGTASQATQPRHAYTAPGTYTVVLQMRSGDRVARYEREVFVVRNQADIPTADFGFNPANPATNQAVQFNDRSRGTVTAWAWDFGDGDTSTVQHPTKAFDTSGTFDVTLTVTGPAGDKSTKTVPVTVTPGRVPPPTAVITISTPVADRVAGKPITFEDTTAAPRPLTTPVFTFPTGQVSPPAGQRTVQYVFANPGTFPVTMKVCWVEDPANCGEATVAVEVKAAVERPVADFTVSGPAVIADPPPPRLVTGQPVTFTDASTGEGINSWTWSIAGQPQPNTPQVTIAGFDRPGRVTVTLTVANAAGQSAPVSREYEVLAGEVTPSFTATSPVEVGTPARFTDTTEGYVTRWEWNFGDGTAFATTNPAERSPDHTYAAPNSYEVELVVFDAFGAPHSVKRTVTVTEPAQPAPTVDAVELQSGTPLGPLTPMVAAGVPVQFSDTSTTGPATTWTWQWGDATPDGQGRTATHTFSEPGTYTVKLTATNAGGTTELAMVILVLPSLRR